MKPIILHQSDSNSTSATIREWKAADRSNVTKGQIVASVETSKALYDIEASADGVIVHLANVGDEVPFQKELALVAEGPEKPDQVLAQWKKAGTSKPKTDDSVKATKKAQALAESLHIDLASIKKDGIINEDDVKKAAGNSGKKSAIRFLGPDEYPAGVKRVVAIGAANALAQLVDILAHDPSCRLVGCVDDSDSLVSNRPFGIPLIGKTKDLKKLYADNAFDHAIVTVSSSNAARKKLFEEARALGIPFINAIDPSARILSNSSLGVGNVICAFVHIGTLTSLGDNNFVSAHCSIDHHNIWGSHNTLGPGCCFSGRVKVGDGVKFATGVFVQNGIEIQNSCTIASGAMITTSIPANHIVKTTVTHHIIAK